jgi:hypothetical protein
MTEKLYPKIPSAPPDDGLERSNRVQAIRNELQVFKNDRWKYYKRYSKATAALQNLTIALGSFATAASTAGIATSLTVVGIPVGVVLTGLGAAAGLTAVIFTPIAKHCGKKKNKHSKKHSILSTGITMLDKKISRALDDSFIDDKEFDAIVDEYNRVLQLLENFNLEKVKTEVREEFANELLQRMPSKRN